MRGGFGGEKGVLTFDSHIFQHEVHQVPRNIYFLMFLHVLDIFTCLLLKKITMYSFIEILEFEIILLAINKFFDSGWLKIGVFTGAAALPTVMYKFVLLIFMIVQNSSKYDKFWTIIKFLNKLKFKHIRTCDLYHNVPDWIHMSLKNLV